MKENFDRAFEALIGHEGGYVNHPKDPGGETMYGVTKRVAIEHGYTGDMRKLTLAEAKRIAKAGYWDKVRADELPDELDFQMFDTAYNSGHDRAIRLLQRATDTKEDGKLGPNTMGQVEKADHLKRVPALCARFNGHRLIFLAGLGTWGSFGKGWARRVANNLIRII